MNKNDFINISIRGRVAYAICCLENTIKYCGYSIKDWTMVLKQLWKYTNIEFLDDWHYSTAEFLPESILEFARYKEENFEYITEEQFDILYKIYKNSDNTAKDIIKFIFNIGVSEFYGRLENNGQRTLDNLEMLINYMISNNIPLPDRDKFMPLSYNEGNGWGKMFEGELYSCIL